MPLGNLHHSPFVDATLGDGSRLHVVIPDITRRHWVVNIRKLIFH
jgi:pilus assembly protein CpaF